MTVNYSVIAWPVSSRGVGADRVVKNHVDRMYYEHDSEAHGLNLGEYILDQRDPDLDYFLRRPSERPVFSSVRVMR